MAKKKQALEMPEVTRLTGDVESEKYVLASLFDPFTAESTRQRILSLPDEAFFFDTLQEVFKSAKRVKSAGQQIDTDTVYLEMSQNDKVKDKFDYYIRKEKGMNWERNDQIIELEIKKAITLNSILPDSGRNAGLHIEALRRAYAKRAAQKTATMLANADKIGTEDLVSYLSNIKDDLTRATRNNYGSIFANTTIEQIQERNAVNLDGIGTNYYVFANGTRKEIKIPRGQISLVCAQPGHCKSTLLLNLALRLAYTEPGQIIYWTFEESEKRTSEKFQSLTYGKPISKPGTRYGGNIDRIRDYFKGRTDHIEDVKEFENSLQEFQNMELSGKIKILSNNLSSLDFVSALRAHIDNGREVAAVFVDYIQIVKSGRNLETRHDIAEALNDFLTFAKETNIPVIAAAQLNRDAKTPQMMGGRYIAESADLTRFADTILCLWNPLKEEDLELTEKERAVWLNNENGWYYQHMRRWGAEIGKGGSLYIKVTKSREMETGADAVYSFDGDTKVIGRPTKEIKKDSKDSEDLPSGNDGKGNPDNFFKKNTTETPTAPDKSKEIRRQKR